MMATGVEEADVVTCTDADHVDDAALGKEEQKHRFVVMRAKGYSYARIGRELGVSKGTLTAWNAEMEAEVARTSLASFRVCWPGIERARSTNRRLSWSRRSCNRCSRPSSRPTWRRSWSDWKRRSNQGGNKWHGR